MGKSRKIEVVKEKNKKVESETFERTKNIEVEKGQKNGPERKILKK